MQAPGQRAASRRDGRRNLVNRTAGNGVGIELDHIGIAAQVEQGQQPLPAAAARTVTGLDRRDTADLGPVEMMREQQPVSCGQGPVIEDHETPASQLRVERLGGDQVGVEDPRPDHREHDHAVVDSAHGRRIEHGAGRQAKLALVQLADHAGQQALHRADLAAPR